jgi:hypothetical protein
VTITWREDSRGCVTITGGEDNGGKWRLTRKDGFGQAPAKLKACNYHRGRRQHIHGHSGNFKI